MPKLKLFLLMLFIPVVSYGQRVETVYLNPNDSTANMYIAVIPEKVNSFLILLDGYGNSPKGVLTQTNIPTYAAQQGILTIIPLLATGPSYFGSDIASQQSLKEIINLVVSKYQLQDKDFFIGGFAIGGTCAVKFAELAVQENFSTKPKAIFAINPILDWERYYNGAKRVIRLSNNSQVNKEIFYMIERIEKEANGTPKTALENYYNFSPYSFSDTTQKAVKNLINIPLMIITEPEIQWWLEERGYDLSYNNITDHTGIINELQRLGNKNAVLVTTTNQGYRKPDNNKHPNSWSIADPVPLIKWLMAQE